MLSILRKLTLSRIFPLCLWVHHTDIFFTLKSTESFFHIQVWTPEGMTVYPVYANLLLYSKWEKEGGGGTWIMACCQVEPTMYIGKLLDETLKGVVPWESHLSDKWNFCYKLDFTCFHMLHTCNGMCILEHCTCGLWEGKKGGLLYSIFVCLFLHHHRFTFC